MVDTENTLWVVFFSPFFTPFFLDRATDITEFCKMYILCKYLPLSMQSYSLSRYSKRIVNGQIYRAFNHETDETHVQPNSVKVWAIKLTFE